MSNQHTCDLCKKNFDRLSRLVAHKRIHTGEKPYACTCGRSYMRKQYLVRHESSCAKIKNLSGNSASSSEEKQSELTLIKCHICESGTFKKRKHLSAHIAIVHGNRKFKCSQCSKEFVTLSKLTRHLKHHNYKCDICDNMSFHSFIEFRRHKAKEHKKLKFLCTLCKLRFSRNMFLQEHITSVHTTDKRFVCKKCPSPRPTFFHKRNLDAHTARIHEECYFPCFQPHCPVVLSSKQKLKIHVKRHETNTNPSQNSRKRMRLKTQPAPESFSKPSKRIKDYLWETDSQSSITISLNREL